MNKSNQALELLAPAKSAAIGREAILHGADVYIGGPSFGARNKAGNTLRDMGLLELDLPPIALHASTQCDIRTPEKARFLSEVGFSQLVLARELTLAEIAAVRTAVPADTVLEHFIHGALCVAYSGQSTPTPDAAPIVATATLLNGSEKLRLEFDCRNCEMHVIGKMKKHIQKPSPPTAVPVTFHARR